MRKLIIFFIFFFVTSTGTEINNELYEKHRMKLDKWLYTKTNTYGLLRELKIFSKNIKKL